MVIIDGGSIKKEREIASVAPVHRRKGFSFDALFQTASICLGIGY
jgi:hypothetical protein